MDVSSSAARAAVVPPPDPYALAPDAVEAAPASLASALRRTGPGIVLAASIVGSGEVIATTTLGAQVGYSALWIVLVSCAIKPVVQGELGRYTIATGETGLEGFNRLPGPRAGVNWLVWAWALMVASTLMQVGGMYGGVAQVLNLLAPPVSVNVWVGICLAITLATLLGGGYQRIERFALVKVGLFTLLTVCAAVVLLRRPGAVELSDLASGLSLRLPPAGLVTAIAVFGITGVGATELVMYPYWCIEKGYARFVGPREPTREWVTRARGWIRVMHVDILCSLAVYTLATVAFYLLGAGVLYRMGVVPASRDTVKVLSQIYTQTLGGWALWVFYIGVVVTLYGTIFAATAAHARLFADAVRIMGFYAREDAASRRRWRDRFVVALTVVPPLFYWIFESPVRMVVAGGVAQALMLPLIGTAVTYLRHTSVPAEIRPSPGITGLLWLCTAVMFGFAIYSAWSAFGP
ncbi:MAG TPA: Nramp family divalent metal transporter [Vicinamibacterales bacterium]|jgi:Mn2+/Fe2+ NRAMP family transporter|nr:Nramp family divalent metal transporter [Vicinamibacterales bacterium]